MTTEQIRINVTDGRVWVTEWKGNAFLGDHFEHDTQPSLFGEESS
jgi:hypothetical protein